MVEALFESMTMPLDVRRPNRMPIARNPAGLSFPETTTLSNLAREIEDLGLGAFLAAFSDSDPQPSRWAPVVAAQNRPLRSALEFFLLGRRVLLSDLPGSLASCLRPLSRAGILDAGDGHAQLIDVVLMRPHHAWLFASPPMPFPVEHYFGADTVELARRVTLRPGSACLDLCAGTGLQAILAAQRCARVDAVELLAPAAAVAEINAALNDVSDRVTVYVGDLFAPVPTGTKYDHVIANIPFLPSADTGIDGFGLGGRLLAELPEWLNPTGCADLTAMVLATPNGPLLPDRLIELAGATSRTVQVSLTERWSVDADSLLVQTITEDFPADDGETVFVERARRISQTYAQLRVVEARTAFVHIGPIKGENNSGVVEIMDLSGHQVQMQ